MSVTQAVGAAKPWIAIGGASVMAATILAIAPEASALALGGLIAAWVALGIVRVVILVGLARQAYDKYFAAQTA